MVIQMGIPSAIDYCVGVVGVVVHECESGKRQYFSEFSTIYVQHASFRDVASVTYVLFEKHSFNL